MKYWIIRHLPVWILKLLKKYNWAFLELYCRYDHRLDFGCNCDPLVGEKCEECCPVGVPEWLLSNSKSFGCKDESYDKPLGLNTAWYYSGPHGGPLSGDQSD